MARIELTQKGKNNIFLCSTSVENLFINEFLPSAPAEYLKVYLFGLMYAQYGQEMDSRKLAMQLGISESDVLAAWEYWEALGLVSRGKKKDDKGNEILCIGYTSLVDELYGSAGSSGGEKPSASAGESAGTSEDSAEPPLYVSIDDMDFDDSADERLTDSRLRALYQKYQDAVNRTISRRETERISDAVNVYGIEPEVFAYSIGYCADIGKDNIEYIFTVARRWAEEGCATEDDVKAVLEKHSLRNSWYSKVFRALGWNRLPAPADREIMDRWFDGLGCSIDEVLDACAAAAGIREPNLRYVNRVIENRRLEQGGINAKNHPDSGAAPSEPESPVSRRVLAEYYEYIREEGEKEQKARVNEAVSKVADLRRLFEAESALNSRMLALKPGADSRDIRQRLRTERIQIDEAKKELLTAAGYPADYLSRRYRCSKCRDSGYTDEGMVCSCAKERAEEAFAWNKERNRQTRSDR